MSTTVIDKEIIDTDISIIKQAICPSLSGRSKLTYSIGKTRESNPLIRIEKNSGTGNFNRHWINLDSIQALIKTTDKPFSWSALSPLFKHQSVNTAGFIMAALVKEGLVIAVDGGYERTDKDIKAIRSRRKAA